MNSYALNKKGQAANYIAAILFIFGFAVLSIIGVKIYDEYVVAYNDTGTYTGIIKQTGDNIGNALLLYDYIIVLILVVLIVAVGITNFKLKTQPAFFIITVIQAVFIGLASYFFNYIFIKIVSEDVFQTVLVHFPRSLLICTNLHWVALVLIVVGSLTLYGKKPEEEAIL